MSAGDAVEFEVPEESSGSAIDYLERPNILFRQDFEIPTFLFAISFGGIPLADVLGICHRFVQEGFLGLVPGDRLKRLGVGFIFNHDRFDRTIFLSGFDDKVWEIPMEPSIGLACVGNDTFFRRPFKNVGISVEPTHQDQLRATPEDDVIDVAFVLLGVLRCEDALNPFSRSRCHSGFHDHPFSIFR